MKIHGNFKIFFEIVMHEMATIIQPIQEDPTIKKELEDALWNSINDLDGPRVISKKPNDKAMFISRKLFHPVSEIFSSVESLENISIYVGSFPYKNKDISRLEYFKYHIENYLNEIYILKNRLIAYLKLLERSYKNCNRTQDISSALRPQYEIVSNALSGYVDVRGSHVHELRYSDADIDRLSTLNLLSNSREESLSEVFLSQFIAEYRKTRKKWVGKIKQDIEEINKLLDGYFSAIIQAICTDGTIIYPTNTKWA